MKTNIIYPNRTQNYPPLGSLYLADALNKDNIDSELLSSNITNSSLEDIIKENPNVPISMSVLTSPQISDFVRLSKHIKNVSPQTPIIWGGAHPTINPNQVISESYVDSVVVGSGEEILPRLIKNHTSGIHISNPRIDLNKYSPMWDKFDNLSQFVFNEDHSVRKPEVGSHNIFYYLSTSRGCFGKCSFCAVPELSKNKWYSHSANDVSNQLDYLSSKTSFNGVGIWDDMFWTNMKRAGNILHGLKERNFGYLIEARADHLLKRGGVLFDKLKNTNCLQVFVGAESGNQNTLNYLNKNTSVDDYLRLSRMAQESEMPVRYSFIVGFPGETDVGVNDTLDLASKLKDTPYCSVSGPKLFTPYPGTLEYGRAINAGFKNPHNTEAWAEIHRRTDGYLEKFPWLKENLSPKTLKRMDNELR